VVDNSVEYHANINVVTSLRFWNPFVAFDSVFSLATRDTHSCSRIEYVLIANTTQWLFLQRICIDIMMRYEIIEVIWLVFANTYYYLHHQ
jgi:hypothetical protein